MQIQLFNVEIIIPLTTKLSVKNNVLIILKKRITTDFESFINFNINSPLGLSKA